MTDFPRLSDEEADRLRARYREWQQAEERTRDLAIHHPTQLAAIYALNDRADNIRIDLMRDAFRFLPTFLAAYYEDQVT